MSREAFIDLVTTDLPERPEYFFRDKEINRDGAPPLGELPPLAALTPQEVAQKQAEGAMVLDTRSVVRFGAGHVPGSIHIALSGQFASWAGTLIGIGPSVVLVAEDAERLEESRVRLARIGVENVVGYLDEGVLAWDRAGMSIEEVPQISALRLYEQLRDEPDGVQVVDVRRAMEWRAGHLERALLKPLDRLRTTLGDLSTAKPVAVYCQSGYRSSIGTSLLESAGFKQTMNVVGGFDAWKAQKFPQVSDDEAAKARG